MYQRYCLNKIETALKDTPVVIISGPRQAGKTTLAKQIRGSDSRFITLDDQTQFDSAKRDPVGFIRNLSGSPTILDEVQRVPELFLAIKQSVDENRQPGRFLLTGSSNALMLPTLSDSLAGRMEIVNLLPLADCEISGTPSTFIDKLLQGKVPSTQQTRVRNVLIKKVLAGGYPEPYSRDNETRRFVWYQQYLMSIIQKDLKDLGKLEHIEIIPKLIRLLATQVAQLTNYTELANKLGFARQTITNYIGLLEQLYLVYRLPAWHKNESKRLVKTPKIHVIDSGLLCALRRFSEENFLAEFHKFGFVLENYVVNEIKRLATWHDEPIEFYHYRDKDKVEVDLILETYAGKLIAIEIKAAATVTHSDFLGLQRFKELAGSQFLMGMILYDGDHSTQHAEGLFSLPIGVLWE